MIMPAISRDTRLKVSSDVVFRELEGEAVILNLASGTYFGLDAVGTRIWQLLQSKERLGDVLVALGEEYDGPPGEIEADLLRLASELVNKGLAQVV